MSCAGCHKQELAFSDNTALSIGIDGIQGTRNAMPLINLAFVPFGLNWDGSANTLELQAAIPVTSAVELHETWANVEIKLKRHALYPKWFREAFGIEKKGQIKEDLARKAIAQFVRTLVSHESHYDQSLGFVDPNNVPFLTASEERGRKLLISENSDSTDKECTHCHKFGNRLFTDNTFRNNGLDESQTFFAFPDLGRGGVTGNPPENGTFRVPTLRNIMLTAPYMHDGRFATIEEVLDHYADHLKYAPNLDPLLGARMTGQKIYFTQQEKEDLINFLKTLTDTAFISNPKFSNPW